MHVPRGRSCTYAKSIGSSPGQHKQPSATTRKTQADASWRVLLCLRPSSRPAAPQPQDRRQNGSSGPSEPSEQRAVPPAGVEMVPREAGEIKNVIKNLPGLLRPRRVSDAQGTPHLDPEYGASSMCLQGEGAGLGPGCRTGARVLSASKPWRVSSSQHNSSHPEECNEAGILERFKFRA